RGRGGGGPVATPPPAPPPPGPGERVLGGGMGGLLGGAAVSAEVRAKLTENADAYTWVAAAVGSQNAASHQLATEEPVMPIGGFNGTDPSPTLEQFKRYVEEGRIHYFIAGGGMRGGGGEGPGGPGGGGGSEITSWVTSTFQQVTVDGATLYDLTAKAGAE
ncbi:glycosyl transferase, partial [Streptomyces sp. Act-28]